MVLLVVLLVSPSKRGCSSNVTNVREPVDLAGKMDVWVVRAMCVGFRLLHRYRLSTFWCPCSGRVGFMHRFSPPPSLSLLLIDFLVFVFDNAYPRCRCRCRHRYWRFLGSIVPTCFPFRYPIFRPRIHILRVRGTKGTQLRR